MRVPYTAGDGIMMTRHCSAHGAEEPRGRSMRMDPLIHKPSSISSKCTLTSPSRYPNTNNHKTKLGRKAAALGLYQSKLRSLGSRTDKRMSRGHSLINTPRGKRPTTSMSTGHEPGHKPTDTQTVHNWFHHHQQANCAILESATQTLLECQ